MDATLLGTNASVDDRSPVLILTSFKIYISVGYNWLNSMVSMYYICFFLIYTKFAYW